MGSACSLCRQTAAEAGYTGMRRRERYDGDAQLSRGAKRALPPGNPTAVSGSVTYPCFPPVMPIRPPVQGNFFPCWANHAVQCNRLIILAFMVQRWAVFAVKIKKPLFSAENRGKWQLSSAWWWSRPAPAAPPCVRQTAGRVLISSGTFRRRNWPSLRSPVKVPFSTTILPRSITSDGQAARSRPSQGV